MFGLFFNAHTPLPDFLLDICVRAACIDVFASYSCNRWAPKQTVEAALVKGIRGRAVKSGA